MEFNNRISNLNVELKPTKTSVWSSLNVHDCTNVIPLIIPQSFILISQISISKQNFKHLKNNCMHILLLLLLSLFFSLVKLYRNAELLNSYVSSCVPVFFGQTCRKIYWKYCIINVTLYTIEIILSCSLGVTHIYTVFM